MEEAIDIQLEIMLIAKLAIAIVLGGIVGYDRERDGNDAGIRTYASVCLGAALFTTIGIHVDSDKGAISRVVANIITGIGFLGAGLIYKGGVQGNTHGLTTAATMWATAAVGVAIALNMFLISIVTTVFLYFLLNLHHYKWYERWKQKIKRNHHH